jgi:hypothetical protein
MEIKKLTTYYLPAVLILMLGGLTSCKKPNNSTAGVNRPVVEGYLVPGTKTLVKIYYQKYLDDTITYGYPITGLKLSLSDGTTTVQLAEGTPGNYTWNDSTFIKTGKTYSLSFNYQGAIISAKTTVPDKPAGFKASDTLQLVNYRAPGAQFNTEVFTPTNFTWTSPASWYYLMVFKNTSTYFVPTNSNSTTAYHDSEVLVGQTAFFETQPTSFAFTGQYKILLYHINQEYNDAINSGGGTSLSLTNPVTNVVNGLGIFTSMQADTLNLDVKLQ